MSSRPGFALATVLWLLVVAGGLVATAFENGRDAIQASRNRSAIIEARWNARSCATWAFAALNEAYVASNVEEVRDARWAHMDSVPIDVHQRDQLACDVDVISGEARLDVTALTRRSLEAFLEASAVFPSTPDAADGLADWIDGDEEARPTGHEDDWYVSRSRPRPRNAAPEDARELLFVRGWEGAASLAPQLAVSGGFMLDISHASSEVLAAVPGFTPRLAAELVHRRDLGWRPRETRELLAVASADEVTGLRDAYSALEPVILLGPRSWIVSVATLPMEGSIVRREELRVVRTAERLVVTGRRTW